MQNVEEIFDFELVRARLQCMDYSLNYLAILGSLISHAL